MKNYPKLTIILDKKAYHINNLAKILIIYDITSLIFTNNFCWG